MEEETLTGSGSSSSSSSSSSEGSNSSSETDNENQSDAEELSKNELVRKTNGTCYFKVSDSMLYYIIFFVGKGHINPGAQAKLYNQRYNILMERINAIKQVNIF